ncbi:hypothetical protein L0P85_00735 [Terrisporobacter glycolicus]|nr:hypothetical protein L0P85_00735 [Terrisporobacter glycolicus]
MDNHNGKSCLSKSDNYRYCGMSEVSVIVKTVSEFTNYFSYHYGGPTGAIHFVK